MKVEELIIDGFKSYATRTVISGWDAQFNAITGLNGSGKSNILDAICFVLGIASMSTVRASNLQDLIYKRGQAGVTKASVTIIFNNNEKSKSPIGFEKFPTISVTRQIILGGNSKYLINGHKAQQQTVLNLFQSVQLNINNPNFLIMQGKITKVLNMKPSEILSLIEEAAGTRTFEDRKDKAQKTMAKKEAKLIEIRNLLKEEIDPKLEKLRIEKRNFLEFQQTQIDLEKLSRIITAYDYISLSEKFTKHSSYFAQHEEQINSLHDEIEKLNVEIQNLNDDLNQIKVKRDSDLLNDAKLKEMEQSENQLSNEIARLKTARDISLENLKEETKKKDRFEKQLEALDNAIKNNQDIYSNHEMNYKKSNDELAQLKDDLNKKEELVSSLSTGISSKGNVSTGYTAQLNEVKEKLNSSENFVKTSKLKIAHLEQQIGSDKIKLRKAKEDNQHILASISNHKAFIADKQSELDQKLGFDPARINELRNQESELLSQRSRLNNELNYMKRDIGNIDFQYSRPSADFNDNLVRGIVAQLFTLQEGAGGKAGALQICAGGRLYNVVVDTSDIASQLLERGQLRRRVTFIPLDKIHARSVDANVIEYAKQLVPGKVDLALNLIEFEKDLCKAMEYIFGSTFICNDPDTAKAVTFDPRIRTRSITLEGDIYDPEGNLSGGSRKNDTTILLKLQRYNKEAAKLKEIELELGDIREELGNMEALMDSTKILQNEINLKKHELGLLEKKLANNPSSLILKQNEENEREITNLSQQIQENEQNCVQYREEIARIEKEIHEFNNDKGSKIKDLKVEISKLKKEVNKKQKQVDNLTDKFQVIQIESEQHKTEMSNTKEALANCDQIIEELTAKSERQLQEHEKASQKLEIVKAELDELRANLLGLEEEMNEVKNLLKEKHESINEYKLTIQKLTHELEKSGSIGKSLKTRLDEIINENEWVMDSNVVENIIEQNPNIELEESREQLNVLQEKCQSMRRKVNGNIMSMIDNVEKKEASLKTMVKTIEKDKTKIVHTIEKLDSYKRETLTSTYQKVSTDFGLIFADLLPGSFAKLVPVSETDVTKGLEVKVKLGAIWKESLVELSGGQRSLIALSLIMALLQFKPAPMYILDEVDAALDLSHTQNIGHLIKTRFKGSQFIVVSLKEGMFTNANRVFRTRFQDGTSVVSVM
ncbi:SMC2 [[Candida] subhashii]|uniref:Structural maintenance of chromosomes protein n=1 Tax=[Candida] subhashii TaxID=561895 RepID=A0A8J5UVM0_9ASCO|nr:SMC2 [[Candida] subhashii]KAG7662300.1 SMC2 [[Candida] subhashii]